MTRWTRRYFSICRIKNPHGRGNEGEDLYFGLLGNGVYEVAVTLKSGHGCVDVIFDRSELFSFVEEEAIRQ